MASVVYLIHLSIILGAFATIHTLFIFALIASFKKKRGYKDFTPNISVVIPVHNEEKVIGKCLGSILKSNYPKSRIEVVIVNDKSTDNTMRVLREFEKRFSKFITIQGKYTGKSNALNLGVKKSKYEYIIVLDADVDIDKDFIRSIIAPLQYKEYSYSTCPTFFHNTKSMVDFWQENEFRLISVVRSSTTKLFGFPMWFGGQAYAMRKSVLKDLGYFANVLNEDMDIALREYLSGHKAAFVDDARYSTLPKHTVAEFFKQRTRWNWGFIQVLSRNLKSSVKSKNVIVYFYYYTYMYWYLVSLFVVINLVSIITHFYDINLITIFTLRSSSFLSLLFELDAKTNISYLFRLYFATMAFVGLFAFTSRPKLRAVIAYTFYPLYFLFLHISSVYCFIKFGRDRRKASW